jgi:hypothetical protein
MCGRCAHEADARILFELSGISSIFRCAVVVLAAGRLLHGSHVKIVEKLEMQEHARLRRDCLVRHPVIAEIPRVLVPSHERDLGQAGENPASALGRYEASKPRKRSPRSELGVKDTFAQSPRNVDSRTEIAREPVVRACVEERCGGDQVAACVVSGLGKHSIWIEIEDETAERFVSVPVEVFRQRAQWRLFAAGERQQLIDVDRHAPEPDPELRQQGVEPIDPSSRLAEAAGGAKEVNVGLAGQVLGASVRGLIVDDEEPVDSEGAIMAKKRRKAEALVSAFRERTYFFPTLGPASHGRLFEQHVTGSAESLHQSLRSWSASIGR